ncbi:replication A 70 kDa DNA-binding subunit [Brachionus plicatilis]|uniref:Replication protein A subunit n=1 Tax=Brachionus plicatilis TaxID=10195 RepID=A0A3M7S981_BRAPC|nr:replication A 70 kDa DNA-binding subunit [Brachionus plicatilis]
MFQLTRGSLKKILDGNNVADPILQITQMKNIQNNMDGMTRYKVTLFDGETQHTFGILATQKNALVESNQLRIGSVIKLEEFAANVLSKDPPKVVIILLNFEILGEMDANSKQQPAATISQPNKHVQNENIEPNKSINQNKAKSFFDKKEADFEKPQSTNPPGTFNGFKVFGISSLNPYQNKWAIKARVTNKSNIRTYSNARGEGKLFNVELIDNTGEIRANGFNDQVDKFYEMLQIDQVYYISKATLKTANKQYCRLDNDYEMTFNNETVIQPCDETDNLPRINLNLAKISDISNHAANDFVDVIGVVKSVGDCMTIVTKSTNKELKKRELSIVDNSECAITATLWGKQAEDYDSSDSFPVILLKGAKVGDYNGRTLSVTSTTVVQINPDIPEAHTVKGWFEQGGSESEIQDLSSQGAGGSGMGAGTSIIGHTNWKFLDQLKDEKLGMGDKADYFSTKAYVLYAKKDNSMYTACPGENCNKKIFDQNDGTYRCEKCARNYPNFKWRMILNINLADFADSNWATCFQETAETILGIGTEELGELKNSNDPKFDEVFSECAFKEFNFKLRAKMETYNDERRVKVSAVTVEPIDYVQSGRRILEKIKQFAKEQV